MKGSEARVTRKAMDGRVSNEHKADRTTDFMDSIIRACCLCSSSLSMSSRYRRSLHEKGRRERKGENEKGDFAQHNLNLYRSRSMSWQDYFTSVIKAIVTELDEFFLEFQARSFPFPFSQLLFILFRYNSPRGMFYLCKYKIIVQRLTRMTGVYDSI